MTSISTGNAWKRKLEARKPVEFAGLKRRIQRIRARSWEFSLPTIPLWSFGASCCESEFLNLSFVPQNGKGVVK